MPRTLFSSFVASESDSFDETGLETRLEGPGKCLDGGMEEEKYVFR